VILYVDTSAFLAALGDEPHSPGARALLATADAVSSALLEIELARATAQADRALRDAVADRLRSVRLIDIDRAVVASAARIAPGVRLRTLDAIHLATAMAVPDEVRMVTLDQRLLAASLLVGVEAAPIEGSNPPS
jgi:predicted nucleic acid-binding protein